MADDLGIDVAEFSADMRAISERQEAEKAPEVFDQERQLEYEVTYIAHRTGKPQTYVMTQKELALHARAWILDGRLISVKRFP